MIVEIHRINRGTWHNLPPDRNISQPLVFNPAIDGSTRQYNIAMSSDELEEIAKRTGYDLSLAVVPGQAHPFWDSPMMRIKLDRATVNVIDVNSDVEKLRLAVIKGSGLVAHTEQALLNGDYPNAEFFIYSEEEQIQRDEDKAARQIRAVTMLNEMTDASAHHLLKLLSTKRFTKRSAEFVRTALMQKIMEDVNSFITYAAMPTERLRTYVLIEEAVLDGKLQKEGTSYYYGSDRLGFTREETAEFLEQNVNQPIYQRLLELVGQKM